MSNPTTKEYIIDARGKRLGRVATEAASILLGKDTPEFVRHAALTVTVKIENARLIDMSEKKREREVRKTYSGYPSGQRVETRGHLALRRGYGEVIRRAISGMLPKNRLHKERMKHLEISE